MNKTLTELWYGNVLPYEHKRDYYNCIDKKGPDDLDHQVFCVYQQEFDVNPKKYGFRHNLTGSKMVLEMFFDAINN